MSAKSKVVIANCGGFWGDDPTAARRQVAGGPVDYLVMDYLAEVTMAILQKQKAKRPDAGYATGEKLWRLPLGPKYDKMIDSKVADIKNTGGRWGGSISAAQFLQRFIKEGTSWAHLDIAGTAMASVDSEINRSWGSGFGVRLLDQLVRDHYEKH